MSHATALTHTIVPMIDTRFVDLLAIYEAELLERVVPFWLEHAIDWRNGGILTCISDEGVVLSSDKYMWSQLRAIWTFAALYNRVAPRQAWLDVACHIYEFARRHGRDDSGRWVFAVDNDGDVVEGATSIYTDGFAIYGLSELARALDDATTGPVGASPMTGLPSTAAVVDLALESHRHVRKALSDPGSYQTAPYTVPEGAKAHAVSMIFSLAFNELGHYLQDDDIIATSLEYADEVMDTYRRPEQQLLYELVNRDNTLIDSSLGRTVVPGHAIESMWFMIHIYKREENWERVRQAIETIRWHLDFGWDNQYGGLFHALDAIGGGLAAPLPEWPFPDAKLWWPHTEAIYALLKAYEISREPWCLEWFARIHNYAFTHYPVPGHGEWTQKLDRHGDKMTDTVALPVKDPFHLPRALIHSRQVLRRLANMPEDV